MLRRIISYSLLITLLFLLTPKSIWHDCSDQHQVSEHVQGELHFEQDHCAFCDLHLWDFNAQLPFRFKIPAKTKIQHPDYQVVSIDTVVTPFFRLRAPPVLIS